MNKKSTGMSGDIYKTKRRKRRRGVYTTPVAECEDSSGLQRLMSRRRARRIRITLNILLSVVLIVSTLAFTATSLFTSQLLHKSKIDQTEDGSFKNIVSSKSENVSYILVCGLDLSENLTDVIMVLCYDLANNEVNALQIPRDTFAGTDINSGKINAVYESAQKGESRIKCLIRYINDNFGLPIDHYVTFTIQGAKNVIDTVGGVDIKLTRSIKLTDDTKKNPDGSDDNEYNTVGPGEVHLDGKWGVAFIRNRNAYAAGDTGRVRAQRSFYAAFLKKMTSLDFAQITSLVTTCFDEISTDLTLGQMLGYAQKAQYLNLDKVEIMTVPGEADLYNPDGYYASYFTVYKQDLCTMINDYFLPYSEERLLVEDMEIEELDHNHSGDYDSILQGGKLSEFDTENQKDD